MRLQAAGASCSETARVIRECAGARARTRLARVANFSVLCVSSAWLLPGVTVQTTAMRAPELVRLDASTRVSLEARKGTCAAAPSLSLAITEPSASSERLMKLPSLVCQRVTAAWRVARLQPGLAAMVSNAGADTASRGQVAV